MELKSMKLLILLGGLVVLSLAIHTEVERAIREYHETVIIPWSRGL